jgi:hypothetical protein
MVACLRDLWIESTSLTAVTVIASSATAKTIVMEIKNIFLIRRTGTFEAI